MDWKEKYADKIVTVEEAMSHIQPGDLVVPADFCAEPCYLMQGLADAAPKLGGIRVSHGGNVGPQPHVAPGMEKYIDFDCLCAVPVTRKAIAEHRADYLPCFFHQWPRLLGKGGPMQMDVALIQVTEPDENGIVSFGVSSDYTCYMPDVARLTIAQINKNVPWMDGNTCPVEKLDYLVLKDEPVVELLDSVPGEKEQAIAKYVLPLIEDGACLQIGRGKLPDYVMSLLTDRKHLGIHSEMISDGVMKLMKAGAVDNSMKQIHRGKTVCSMIAGSAELYKWVSHNPDIEILPVDYVNDPAIIKQNDNVVSLNSITEIDLMGQAVCDMIGPKQYTGIGGFADFVRGASESKGGKTILAFSSSTGDGKHSRIVATPTPGVAIASTRWDTNYVVTEYGVAQLWGKTNRERAEAMIAIAHPNFRDELRTQAIDLGLIY